MKIRLVKAATPIPGELAVGWAEHRAGIVMIVQCPSCSSRYRINGENIPATGGRIRCPTCQHAFVVYPEAPEQDPMEDFEEKTSIASGAALQEMLNSFQQASAAPAPPPAYSAPAPQPAYSAPAPQPAYSAPAPQPAYNNYGMPADLPEEGTVEMVNPFAMGGFGQVPDDDDEDDGALKTEVVTPEMLAAVQSGLLSQAASPAATPVVPEVPAGPSLTHDGPWKLKTNFGLTYEFPDTKGLKSWLSSREDLEGYTLSAGDESYYSVDAFTQLKNNSGRMTSRTMQVRATSQLPALNIGGAGLPGFQPPQTAVNPAVGPAKPVPGPKITDQPFRPPSRDAKWSGVLWVLLVFLLVVGGGVAVQLGGFFDIVGLLTGTPSTPVSAPNSGASKPAAAEPGAAEAAAGAQQQAMQQRQQDSANRLLEDARQELASNRLAAAAEKLNTAHELAPDRADILEMQVQILERLGQKAEAEKAKASLAALRGEPAPAAPDGADTPAPGAAAPPEAAPPAP